MYSTVQYSTVEYLLRQGYYDTALQLADTAGVAHLSNTEVGGDP